MRRELTPQLAAQRLEVLRALHVTERDEDARQRLERERPVCVEPFERAVARRLEELRALCNLAAHLHRGRLRP